MRAIFPLLIFLLYSSGGISQDFSFEGFGNEPYWTLKIENKSLTFLKGINPVVYSYDLDEPLKKPLPSLISAKSNSAGNIKVLVDKKACFDDMSGQKNGEYSVSIVLEGNLYQGCGKTVEIKSIFDSSQKTKIASTRDFETKFTFDLPYVDKTRLPSNIQVQYGQLGLEFAATFNYNILVNLPVMFTIGNDPLDQELYVPKKSNQYEFTTWDFDDDGIEEIIIALKDRSNGFAHVQFNIFRYHPPYKISDISRKENWEIIGNFIADSIVGTPNVVLEKNTIKIPRNIKGFYHAWMWSERGFIDISYR